MGLAYSPASVVTTSRAALSSVVRVGLAFTAAFALATCVTQVYWLATGDTFGLGIVSAFNPTAIGNLPVFAVTAGLACCAAWAALLAAALRVGRAPGWLAVALLAGGCALLSLEYLAVPRLGQELDWLDPILRLPPVGTRGAVVALFVVALAAIVARAWREAGAARTHLAIGWIAFAVGSALEAVAVAGALHAWQDRRLALAFAGIWARTLQLGGLVFILDAITTWIATVAPDLRIVTDEAAPRALAVTPRPHGIELTIGPLRLVRPIAVVIAALVVASLVSGWAHDRWEPAYRLYRLFDLDLETNVPTWWSAMLLFAPGVVACFQASTAYRDGDRRWLDWLTLGLLFIALGTDEAASLHELMSKPLRALIGAGGWLRYPLIVPGTVIGIVLAIRFRGFMATLGPTRRRLTIAAAVFALGAFVFEMMGGWYAPEAVGPNRTYTVLMTIEETLEMVGSTLALVAMLRHVREWQLPASAYQARFSQASTSADGSK